MNIIESIQKLDDKQQILFLTAVCQRLKIGYDCFVQNYGFGNSTTLEKYIKNLQNKVFVPNLLKKISKLAPDLDDFGGILLASAALDACGGVYEASQFLQNKNPKHLKNLIDLALNVAQMYAHEKPETNFVKNEIEILEIWLEQSQKEIPLTVFEHQWITEIAILI